MTPDPYRTNAMLVNAAISKLEERVSDLETQVGKNENDPDDARWSTKMQALGYFICAIAFALAGAFVLDLTSLQYAGWTMMLTGLAFLVVAAITASPNA